MNLLEAKNGLFIFRLERRERDVLTLVLKQFPVGGGPTMPLSKSGDEKRLIEHAKMLEEALAEQRKEHRRQLDAFLGEQGRFAEDGHNHFRVRLTSTQMDWLLRVLNEVRVGLWTKLGQPETGDWLALEGQFDDVVTMERCALFQTQLLAALSEE